jgi:thiamine kinase-like enzyme
MAEPAESELEAIRRLARRLPQWAGQDLEVRPLAGGITNRNFVVSAGGLSHVLRLPGERTELLGIDRLREAEAARRAAALGIGPPILGEMPGMGTLITQLVPGSHLQAREFLQRLPDVVELLRRWHGSGPLSGAFAIHRIVEKHAGDSASHGKAPPAAYQGLHRASLRIEAAFAKAPMPLVPCHNDLLPANLLFDNTRVWLLDYEYAGMNELFFDLANLSVNAGLDQDAEQRLLHLYFGQCAPAAWARLQLMKLMSELREGMWALVQQAISRLDNDFASYAEERLASAQRIASSPLFDAWIEDAGQWPGRSGSRSPLERALG